jgi:hypothetical protein
MDNMNYFTTSLLDFLSSIKTNNYIPAMNTLYISNNGTKLLTLNMEDKFHTKQKQIPELFNGSLCFMILDSYIDSVFPEMERTSFKNKYDNLPKNNNTEIMFSQLYRILKLYRNATVHNISGISITKDFLEIVHDHKNIKNIFSITHKGIQIIEDMILCYFYYEQINYSFLYKEYLYYSYFDDILKEIKTYNDEYKGIITIDSKKINRYERFNCQSIDYIISDGDIHFKIPPKLMEKMNLAIDINISINGKQYIIPIEVLGDSQQICFSEIKNFEIN